MFGRKGQDPLEPYRKAVKEKGVGFDALLWHSREYQVERFRVISDVASEGLRDPAQTTSHGTNLSIADIGCGNADLYGWLVGAGRTPRRYTGVDGVPELVEACKQRAVQEQWSGTDFVTEDITAEPGLYADLADHGTTLVVYSGSLNTFAEKDAREQVSRAFDAVGAVVFNFLSDMGGRGRVSGPAQRFDTMAMIAWAFERTPRVIVRHDYLGEHDCTIGMFR